MDNLEKEVEQLLSQYAYTTHTNAYERLKMRLLLELRKEIGQLRKMVQDVNYSSSGQGTPTPKKVVNMKR